jgi:hypothetical protein
MCNCAVSCSSSCCCNCHDPSHIFNASRHTHLVAALEVPENVLYTNMEAEKCPICGEHMYNIMVGESLTHSMSFSMITFIKHLRSESGMGLKEAKDFAELFLMGVLIKIGVQRSIAEFKQLRIKQLESQIKGLQDQLAKL